MPAGSPFPDESEGSVLCLRSEALHTIRVRWNDDGEAVDDGCTAKSYLHSDALHNVIPQALSITVSARDQSWVRYGQSFVLVALRDASGAVKCTERLLTVSHNWQQRTGIFDGSSRIISEACEGDYYDVLAVATPYAGRECVCQSALLELTVKRVS
jgi:hypothetical protein